MTDFPQAFPKHKPFDCGAYWHLRQSGLWLAIYDLIGTVTNGGKRPFFSSIKTVATYFGADYETVRRIFRKMTKHGWLQKDNDGYWYVDHDDRAKRYPDECQKRELFTWQNDTDPLVGRVYAMTGGKFRMREGWLKGLRKFTTDQVFELAFEMELQDAKAKRERGQWEGTAPMSCFWRAYKRLEFEAQKTASSRVENTG